MNIEIEKKELLNLIGKTQNIVEKRNTMPVLVNILLEADQKKLKVFATDLEVSLTDEVEAKINQTGKVAVSARNLFEIVKRLGDGPISLIKKENNWLQIKQGKYLSKIVGVSSEDYPVFPAYNPQSFNKIESTTLLEMIDKTIFSVSSDETRYHLNGVFFEVSPKGLRMVATDGHRMSLINKDIENFNTPVQQGVIIPRKGLHEIKKILESLNTEVEIAIEGSQFILKANSTILMIRLIEGKYPNYQQFIPTKLPNKISVPRQSFLQSLERVALLANQKSKAVQFSFSNGKVEISSSNPELGDAKEEVEINYKGQDIKIGFNARYISDVLVNMKQDIVDIELNDQLSPGLIRPHEDQQYTCVIMPMRI
ncbi:MAG: DNA polymerase III subunit beta [Bdellovibrionales bacterium]